ncbi:hypothetical protein JW777_00010 [bacterium]|nr:hypothetical protein [bacterium]
MKTRLLKSIAALVLIVAGCEVRNPVADGSVFPVLSRPSVPAVLRLGDAEGMAVSVKVSDPQGAGDIASVLCGIYLSGVPAARAEIALLDDGTMADLLASDGVYAGRLLGAHLAGAAGEYRIGFLATDRDGNSSDTLFVSFRAVEGASNRRPAILSAVAPDSVKGDDRAAVDLRVNVTDPDGLEDVDSVICDVYPPYATISSARIPLSRVEGGIAADGGPGTFVFIGDMSSLLTGSGIHRFRFCARDAAGLESIPVVREVSVVIPNDPPVLSDAVVPDTVDRNIDEPILLSVRVTDPQGASDIRRVYFNTTKPNGAPSSGNPFLMLDDGTSGDAVAGDGVYSLQIVIAASNALGIYRFDFYAEDNAGATAGPLTRMIAVVDEFRD